MTGFFALECHFGLTFTSEEYIIFFVKDITQALYETLRKTFLALPKPTMLPCTPTSEKSKSWHATSDACPCKLVEVHPRQGSESDPIKDQSLWLRQKNPPNPENLWNLACLNTFNYCFSTLQNSSIIFHWCTHIDGILVAFCIQMLMNKVVLAKLQWHNKIATVFLLFQRSAC